MNLPGFIGTIISYVTAKDRKDELNHQFRAKVQPIYWQPLLIDATQAAAVGRQQYIIDGARM